MILLKILRVLITIVLVVALLLVGFVSLPVFSLTSVVLTSSYFGEDLLDTGAYSYAFSYLVDNYVPLGNPEDKSGNVEEIIFTNLTRDVMPEFFSEVTADYLSDWMKYIKAEVSEKNVPVLQINKHIDPIYESLQEMADDEEFTRMILEQVLESQGDNIDNYNTDEIIAKIEDLEIKEIYIESIDDVIKDPDALSDLTSLEDDPLLIFRSAFPEMSDEELLEQVHSYHGILKYYMRYAYMFLAAVIAAILILFILWVDKLNVPFKISGVILILSAIPLFVVSMSKWVFNTILGMLTSNLSEMIPDISDADFYNIAAIRPIINRMLLVSSIALITGVIFIIAGAIIKKSKTPKHNA